VAAAGAPAIGRWCGHRQVSTPLPTVAPWRFTVSGPTLRLPISMTRRERVEPLAKALGCSWSLKMLRHGPRLHAACESPPPATCPCKFVDKCRHGPPGPRRAYKFVDKLSGQSLAPPSPLRGPRPRRPRMANGASVSRTSAKCHPTPPGALRISPSPAVT